MDAFIPKQMLREMVRRQLNKCHYCQRQMNFINGSKSRATREHLVPKSRGGQDTYSNMRAACHRCNNRRGDLPYNVYLAFCRLHGHDQSISAVLKSLSRSQYELNRELYDAIVNRTAWNGEAVLTLAFGRRPFLRQTVDKLRYIMSVFSIQPLGGYDAV